MKKIPHKFQLLNHTYTVEILPHDRWPKKLKKHVGHTSIYYKKVKILQSDPDSEMHTFLHEITHLILDTMGNPISEDEAFVDMFAGLLAQLAATAE